MQSRCVIELHRSFRICPACATSKLALFLACPQLCARMFVAVRSCAVCRRAMCCPARCCVACG
eukprot:7217416-Alexandrium_andersonii.AAC.1